VPGSIVAIGVAAVALLPPSSAADAAAAPPFKVSRRVGLVISSSFASAATFLRLGRARYCLAGQGLSASILRARFSSAESLKLLP
jgi:hypothetical protein